MDLDCIFQSTPCFLSPSLMSGTKSTKKELAFLVKINSQQRLMFRSNITLMGVWSAGFLKRPVWQSKCFRCTSHRLYVQSFGEGKSIARAEDFFREETQEQLQNGVLTQLMDSLSGKGVVVEQVLIRDIDLPKNLIQQIERKKKQSKKSNDKKRIGKIPTQQEQKLLKLKPNWKRPKRKRRPFACWLKQSV